MTVPPASSSALNRSAAIKDLRVGLNQLQRNLRLKTENRNVISTGIPALDAMLPERGLRRGTLSEFIAAEPGSGAVSLAMRLAARTQSEGPVMVVDADRSFYPPALAAIGVSLQQTVLVRPKSRTDMLWTLEESLRCPGIAAVVCCVDYLKTQEFRRLQLAAEAGTAVGLLLRSRTVRRQPGWADVRLLIKPRPSPPRSFHRRLQVQCVYAKGGFTDQIIELEICDETGAVRVAAGLSDAKIAVRNVGA